MRNISVTVTATQNNNLKFTALSGEQGASALQQFSRECKDHGFTLRPQQSNIYILRSDITGQIFFNGTEKTILWLLKQLNMAETLLEKTRVVSSTQLASCTLDSKLFPITLSVTMSAAVPPPSLFAPRRPEAPSAKTPSPAEDLGSIVQAVSQPKDGFVIIDVTDSDDFEDLHNLRSASAPPALN